MGWQGVREQEASADREQPGGFIAPRPLRQRPASQSGRDSAGAELDEPGGFGVTFVSL